MDPGRHQVRISRRVKSPGHSCGTGDYGGRLKVPGAEERIAAHAERVAREEPLSQRGRADRGGRPGGGANRGVVLVVARALARLGESSTAGLRRAAGLPTNVVSNCLVHNLGRWFTRVRPAVYRLSPRGRERLRRAEAVVTGARQRHGGLSDGGPTFEGPGAAAVAAPGEEGQAHPRGAGARRGRAETGGARRD